MLLFQSTNNPVLLHGKGAGKEKPRANGILRVSALVCALVLMSAWCAMAQTNVVTQHYDISRTGLNANETILTPASVNMTTNPNGFGKLFSYPVDGWVYAQPLYLPGVTMGAGTPQAGTTHNVLFIATEHDSVYAFDADSNAGANANPLWHITLLDTAHGSPAGATTVPNGDVSTGDIVPEIGITGTPVIDPVTNTMYVVGKTKESGTYVQRLHALDITTGAEKFGGPVVLSGSVPGNGSGSSGGTLNWDPKWENNRPGLLLLNGIVYLGFGSHGDNGPWHGWILAYNASNLQRTGVWCASPNGSADGIWMSGSGLAADVIDPVGHPFGRMFTSTGNGSHSAPVNTTVPLIYDNTMNYGDSIIRLDLANGVPTMNSGGAVVGDDFTPHDQANLNNGDTDQASGGALLLPDAVGGGKRLLTQVGKTGRVYLLDRENLGGYNPSNSKDPGEAASVAGMWSMPAYWNGSIYYWGSGDTLKAFSISNGVLSSSPTSSSAESYGFPGATPTVSANGTTNGIVWSIKSDAYGSQGREVLFAHDATNVSKTLYSSDNNVTRDNPGNAVKFTVPTVIDGKVYVGAEFQVSAFGLLNGQQPAATPMITPASQTFNPSVSVTITDSTPNSQIFYTTDGSTPSVASTKYAGAINVTTTTTINAIATAPNFLQSPVASATYTLVTQAAMPSFFPAPGAYTTAQSVTMTSTTPNSQIYYTTNNTAPAPGMPATTLYSAPVPISSTTTLQAIATAPNLTNSPVAIGTYTIDVGGVTSINFGSGFSAGGIVMNGSAKLNGARLRLTDGGGTEAAGAWYNVQANVQTFTTDFSFQVTPGSNPTADGFTFAIEGDSTSVLGPSGGGLGYGPDTPTGTAAGIANSVAVKFDLYSNAGEGINSTGLYTNGASPTTPFVDLTGSGIDLHSGHVFNVHMVYDGTNLTMTVTDATTNAAFTRAFPINIPATVGGSSAYVGFTGGTGGLTAIQEIITWTYVSNGGTQPPTLTSISVTPANQSAAAGTTVPFHAAGTYSDNSTKDITGSVTWASGTPSAATINAVGLATAVAVGNTTISAASGSVSGNTTLTVTAATLKSIAVTPANPSAAAGTTVSFHATGTYSDNSTKDITPSVVWASGTPAAATINASGVATAVAVGSSTISATSGSVSGNTTLTVTHRHRQH
jgi:Legume lectin domain/Chitobiase/beta-hexosaminidase C-terminal domain/Bacterial Ig-like domain (group 2)